MSPSRDGVIRAARRWIGTPWRHQHRLRGVGVDCVGLVIAAGVESGAIEDPGARFRPWRAYSRTPNPNRMRAGLETFMVQIQDPQPGDVAWIAWREAPDLPMHLAILSELQDRPHLIHSAQHIGKVVEHGFTGEWPGMVNSWYRFPNL